MSDAVTGNIQLSPSREDIDWRVEQKLSRLLAERDLYSDGMIAGISWTIFMLVLIWIAFPEIRDFLKAK
jgi:hypothetical protein